MWQYRKLEAEGQLSKDIRIVLALRFTFMVKGNGEPPAVLTVPFGIVIL